MNKQKRCYYVRSKDGEYGYSVVASSCRDAKRMLATRLIDEEGCEWIDLTVHWIKNVMVDDKLIGYVFEDLIEGIGRGAYTYAECECPVCKHEADVKRWDGSVSCEGCYEEKIEKDRELTKMNKMLEARFHDDCFKKIIKSIDGKLVIDEKYAPQIQWFLDSPDAGDENCKCSLCSKQMEEDCPIRLFKEVKR